MRTTVLPNGNLLVQADNRERQDMAAELNSGNRYAAELTLIEGLRKASNIETVDPADIFALTDMPLYADAVRDDDDCLRIYGSVWGASNYMVRDELRDLASRGRIELIRVADFGEDGVTFPSRSFDEAERLAVRAFENCLGGTYVTVSVPDIHGEHGDTIRRVVDIA